jgi:hypothetical protein
MTDEKKVKELLRKFVEPGEKIMRVVGPNADRYSDKDFPNTDCYGMNFMKLMEFEDRPAIRYWKKRFWVDKEDGAVIHAETNFGNKGWVDITNSLESA